MSAGVVSEAPAPAAAPAPTSSGWRGRGPGRAWPGPKAPRRRPRRAVRERPGWPEAGVRSRAADLVLCALLAALTGPVYGSFFVGWRFLVPLAGAAVVATALVALAGARRLPPAWAMLLWLGPCRCTRRGCCSPAASPAGCPARPPSPECATGCSTGGRRCSAWPCRRRRPPTCWPPLSRSPGSRRARPRWWRCGGAARRRRSSRRPWPWASPWPWWPPVTRRPWRPRRPSPPQRRCWSRCAPSAPNRPAGRRRVAPGSRPTASPGAAVRPGPPPRPRSWSASASGSPHSSPRSRRSLGGSTPASCATPAWRSTTRSARW